MELILLRCLAFVSMKQFTYSYTVVHLCGPYYLYAEHNEISIHLSNDFSS